MAQALDHAPADVMRRLLIALGLGADPPAEPWPVFYGTEPTAPDNVITVMDTAGRAQGRLQPTGEQAETYGFQVRVRAATSSEGAVKGWAVADALDRDVYQYRLTVGAATYLVHSVTRTSSVIPFGKQDSANRLRVHTLNAQVTLEQTA